MRILVFIDHMAGGGAARVTSVMCNGLVQRGHEVILAYNGQRETRYALHEHVRRIDNTVLRRGKNHWAGVVLLIERVRRYKQIIRKEQPHVIIGVEPEPYLYARLASIGLGIPVIAVDHTSYRRKQHWFTHWIRWRAYRWANKVSILSHADEAILGKRIPQKIVIHNPLSFPICETETQRDKIILCVGRHDAWEVKGIDRMLRIWKAIGPSHPEWQLVIAGIKQDEGLPPQVTFLGEVQDMPTLYQRAAIFALPSRVEGFPMSLLEAGSQGCCCIAFALGKVTEEIYTNGKSGIIVPDDDEQEFAVQLNRLMDDADLRKSFSQKIREEMRRFSVEQFIDAWEQICNEVCRV